MSGNSATSTLDIVLKDDVSGAAKAVAASLEKVQAEAKSVDEALSKSGTRDVLQSRLKQLGASKAQIEGAAKAWADYAKAEGLALDKSKDWTKEQRQQVAAWENVAVAKLRADRGLERAREYAAIADAKKAEERAEKDSKRRVEEAERVAKAEADARRRAAEVAERDERRRAEQAARDAARVAETEARDRRRLAEQEERDERQRVERRMRDDRMLAEHRAREEHRAAEAAHRHEEMLLHQRQHAIEHHGFRDFVLSSAAMAVSAHAIAHTGEQAWEHGAELQHERLGLRNAGRTPEQVREIEEAARTVIGSTPTASMVESMKVVAETTAAFGSVHHAIENLPFMMKAMSVLKTAGGDNIHGDAASIGQAFAKTFEERQTKPEEFEAEAKAMIPAMVATGGVFNPEQLYAFAQQAKSALPSLSMRFLSKIAPSLIGAQGGERAGTALKAFEDVIAGKVNDKKQAEAFLNLGLLDPKMAIMKAGHAVGWKSGAIKDTTLAMTDPLAWSEQYLIPALKKELEKKGLDTSDREAVQMILNTMFRNQNANMFATEIAQEASRARLHKDEALFSQTAGFDEIYKRNLQDFGVASGAFKEALGNLAAAATAPMMHMAANGLVTLAKGLNDVADWGFAHPGLAATGGLVAGGAAMAGAGWMSYQLMNGFGLGASAKALDAAAGHLMMVGGGPGGWGKVPSFIPAGGAPALAIPAVAEAAAAAIGIMGAAAVVKLVKLSAEAQEPGHGGQWADATQATRDLDLKRLDDQKTEAEQLRQQIEHNKQREKLPGTSDVVNAPLKDRLGQLEGEIAKLEHSLAEVDAVNSSEARAGRAYAHMRKPEQFGPDVPPGWSWKYHQVLGSEEFGPEMPPRPPVAVAPGYPALEKRTFGRYLEMMGPLAAEGVMPAATPPPANPQPAVDTSRIHAAADEAAQVGTAIQTALNVTASPQVLTGSIDAALGKAQQLVAILGQVGAAATSAANSVASIGGAGARPAGPSLASRNRGRFGDGPSMAVG